MKFTIDFHELNKLPRFLKNQAHDTYPLYVRCPMELAPICDDVYSDILNATRDYNVETNIVFTVTNYNIDIKTLENLKTFSDKENINILLEDTSESVDNNEKDYIDLDIAIAATKKLDGCIEFIRQNKFSPFETLLFAYIYATKRPYNEEKKNQSHVLSRSVFHVLTCDKIVCSGYCNIIRALVEKYDDPRLLVFKNTTKYKTWDIHDLHATLISYLRDKKYNINTYSYLDPTIDSEEKNVRNFIDRRFSLSGFMVPLRDIRHLHDRPFMVNESDYYDDDSFIYKSYLDFVTDKENNNSFAYNGIEIADGFKKSLNDNFAIIDYYSKKYQALKNKYPSMVAQVEEQPEFITEDLYKFSKPITLQKIKIALLKVVRCMTDLKGEQLKYFVNQVVNNNVKYIDQKYDEGATNAFSKENYKHNYEK